MELHSTDAEITGIKPKKKIDGDDRMELLDITFRADVDDGLALLGQMVPGIGQSAWKDSGIPNVNGFTFNGSEKIYNCKVRFRNTLAGDDVAIFGNADIAAIKLHVLPRYGVTVSGKIQTRSTGSQLESLHHWLKEVGLTMTIAANQMDAFQ